VIKHAVWPCLIAQAACKNSEGFDIFHVIICLRMLVCVVLVDICAKPVGALTSSTASTSRNEDFRLEFLDLTKFPFL
jgi:hypothetical protein